MERPINDEDARRLWCEAYLQATNPAYARFDSMPQTVAAQARAFRGELAADWAVDCYAERFGDEILRTEIEEFKQARKAGNAS